MCVCGRKTRERRERLGAGTERERAREGVRGCGEIEKVCVYACVRLCVCASVRVVLCGVACVSVCVQRGHLNTRHPQVQLYTPSLKGLSYSDFMLALKLGYLSPPGMCACE